jgi:hypothetical protein
MSSDSSIDPDIQAAFSGASTTSAAPAVDDDIAQAFAAKNDDAPDSAKPRKPNALDRNSYTPTGAIGSYLAGAGSSALQNIGATGHLINDALGGNVHNLGDASRSVETYKAAHPALYTPAPGTGGDLIGRALSVPGQIGEGLDAAQEKARGQVGATGVGLPGSISTALGPIASGVAQIGLGAGALRPSGAKIDTAIEEAHPLSASAQSEAAEMAQHSQAAAAAGVDLPPRELSPGQAYVNDAARRDLNLPKNAPITDGLIDAAKRQNVSPAYNAVKKVPEYPLGPGYQDAIGKVDLSQIDPKWQPPTSGTMTGERAAELSGQLRSVARGLYDDAGNPNLTYAQRQGAREQAQAHYQGAKAVEGGFREGSGQPQLADNWDQARAYNAKAESWRTALDGGGNVSGPKIKKLFLNDEPVSGPMQEVGSVVAQYPEQFRSTRLASPQEGLLKRGARAIAPAAGAALGNFVAPGLMGSAGGAALGDTVAEKLLGPARR